MKPPNPENNTFSSRHVVLGMAGHIDHGKTAVVKSLTGTDTDRLKEEKERGMTTDLGFAFLGEGITIIDVPGHEKFVKTMVAGVNTVDLALLIIAADDGVMPQTVEHLEILNLLGIPSGLIAINKTDLVDRDWLDLVAEEVKKFVQGTILAQAPIFRVSALTGEGMEELKSGIFNMAGQVHAKRDRGVFRMPVDRVFSIKGFGTVVAGTVLSGKLAVDDSVELLPRGLALRVRGLQVHDKAVSESRTGFRTAVNIQGVEKDVVERGNVLAAPGFFRPTQMADARLTLLSSRSKPLKNRERVHAHIGTDEALARIILLNDETLVPGAEGFVQIHFEKSVAMDAGDRFVIRSYSPVRTIGGGVVLDVHPQKHRRFQEDIVQKLNRLLKGDPLLKALEHLRFSRFQPVTARELAKSAGMTPEDAQKYLTALEAEKNAVRIGKDRWIGAENREILKRIVIDGLERFHKEHPERAGVPRAELLSRIKPPPEKQLFEETVKLMVQDRVCSVESDRVRLSGHHVMLNPELQKIKDQIVKALMSAPFDPPDEKDMIRNFGEAGKTVLQVLIESSEAVRLEEGILFHRDAVNQAKEKISNHLKVKKEATVSDIRQVLGTTRKYAVPLVEYLDRIGFTERDGDVRRLKQ